MKKLFGLLIAAMFVSLSLGMVACGDDDEDSGPTCKKVPECDLTTHMFTEDLQCVEQKPCDPPTCAGDGSDYCDVSTGTCKAMPKTCDPACSDTQICNDGTCEDIKEAPKCDPVCAADEVCM